ncbi:uncharacterized protein LOC62_05G007673 [Vanrija pseudolonga]|uniref:Uncharacterized protein n=1 Tax=Vanrija pseudolonga TaxID=143232 RepID=A0AAF0YDX8_9TREE|nr:hypothetical protein LOC62_05G007673 [Vanrija pseudolonga]
MPAMPAPTPREMRSTTAESASASSATITAADTPRRRPQPLQVKGTLGALESPRRELYSPAPPASVRASVPPSPGSTVLSATPSEPSEPAPPVLVFRADPRLGTCFEALPEGGDEVRALFGV